ncbi:MAG: sigma-54 dependent transcriptional regulator [Planctomycetota bacterium]
MKKNQANGETSRKQLRVLFADDEIHLQELIAAELPRMGHKVTVCADGASAIATIEKESFDCMIVDLDMPGLNGIDVIRRTKEIAPGTEAIVLTGKGSTESAIEALRLGAFDYMQKPCKLIELQSLLQRVAKRRELTNHVHALERQLTRVEGQPKMVGNHRSVQRVRALIEKVAPTESTVLVLGETGTGKELVAKSVHELSARCNKPMVSVNCGALPESLIESELFGHRKGAFTGADSHRQGLFEVADGGTIFLDEIGELPKATQSKLLRVLESGEIRRVGDNEPFRVNVRVVCATHRDLPQMVEAGDFRQDLMFRINTFEIHLPPLRDRTEDIPQLAEHLLRRTRTTVPAGNSFAADAIGALSAYDWPGNIRELANVIEHASILCDQLPITADDLPQKFGARSASPAIAFRSSQVTLREIEMQAIHSALEKTQGNKTAAAQQLGISLKTLYNKLNQDAIKRAA